MTKRQINTFLKKLEGPEGCNFHEKTPGDENSVIFRCNGEDQSLSKKILKKMGIPKGEAKEFLARCSALGGHCDCEILFNASDRLF
jgi:hypothetical protein